VKIGRRVFSTILARTLPFATSWRTRDSRTATRENSAAAKKESVEDNQEEYADQANDEHALGILLCRIVAGGRGLFA